jgi:metal-responsive CopG/Arc/MetJ family transcriptional regulator
VESDPYFSSILRILSLSDMFCHDKIRCFIIKGFKQRLKLLKTDRVIGFKEKREIIELIDEMAEKQGLDRSSFLRQLVREKVHAKEV